MVQLLLVFHILGVAALFGGVIAGVICMRQAAGAAEAKVAEFALASVRRINWWTLHLGAALILISGFWMAAAEPTPMKLSQNPWLMYAVVLFVVVLILAMGVQSPLQKKMTILAAGNGEDFPATFQRMVSRWSLISVLNIILLCLILLLMVFKPGQ